MRKFYITLVILSNLLVINGFSQSVMDPNDPVVTYNTITIAQLQVADVAQRVAQADEAAAGVGLRNRLGPALQQLHARQPGLRDRLLSPRKPIDRIIGMLTKVKRRLQSESIGHGVSLLSAGLQIPSSRFEPNLPGQFYRLGLRALDGGASKPSQAPPNFFT